jgi:hypothetical protein
LPDAHPAVDSSLSTAHNVPVPLSLIHRRNCEKNLVPLS